MTPIPLIPMPAKSNHVVAQKSPNFLKYFLSYALFMLENYQFLPQTPNLMENPYRTRIIKNLKFKW